MSGDLTDVMKIASSGLHVQSERLKIIAQNIANSESTASIPGGEPYRRKTITFAEELDRKLGVNVAVVSEISVDDSPFKQVFDPTHPAANDQGYVLFPNVTRTIESLDSDQAQRAYEANLRTIETTKSMLRQTLDLLQ
ncbi:MAG: flagellar basal body rod protein FlgC [Rickettsiales bacterium]|nr:flagellar basal body rod protein FlgC [Rickettsiales bacterium]